MLNDVYSESLAEDLRHLGEEVADAMTRPSVLYRPTLSVYGDKYCMLYGPNIAEGVAGFGDTAAEAAKAFDEAWNNTKAPRMVANPTPDATRLDEWPETAPDGDWLYHKGDQVIEGYFGYEKEDGLCFKEGGCGACYHPKMFFNAGEYFTKVSQ